MLLFFSGELFAKSTFSKRNVHLDKIYKKVSKKTNVNKIALKKAFSYYKKNYKKKGLSKNYLAIADYTKTAKEK
jgi:hypothetical protein